MKRSVSLRLRITLLCAALLTLCCLLLTLTNNLSAIQMAETIQAVPVLPAREGEPEADVSLPMMELEAGEATRQARGTFHLQSFLAMAAILAAGLFLIYRLVGKALAPLDRLTCQIRERTAEDLARPLEIPDSGDEVAELARAFQQMSRRLNQVFVMQKNFSHNAAHEFRTPLAVLKARIGLFRKKKEFSPQATEEFLQVMEGEVDRLSDMVGSLLELTNLEQTDRSDPVPMERLLREAAEEMALLAAERQVTIQTELTPCVLPGDERLLRRAVFNLLENAVKYSPAGSAVCLSSCVEGERLRIEVADRGPGIPQPLRQRIFEPFFRVDDARSRQQGGAGLGLALVRAIAQAHGGTVHVEDGPAGGSRFVMELPCGGKK